MSRKVYELDCLDKKEVESLGADLSEGNEYITETAGYIPLEVKMKQFEQNGIIAQFQVSDFTSNDYRDIYLNPDFEITPEDELEDIQEKLKARNEFMNEIKKSKVGDSERIANSPSDSAAAQTENKVSENKAE